MVAEALLSNTHLFKSTIGLLGWLKITLPNFGYLLPVVAVIICVLFVPRAESSRIRLIEAVWQIALLGASAVLIFVAMYLYFTPVGLNLIIGVQGRYFLPLAGIASVTICATISPLFPNKPLPA